MINQIECKRGRNLVNTKLRQPFQLYVKTYNAMGSLCITTFTISNIDTTSTFLSYSKSCCILYVLKRTAQLHIHALLVTFVIFLLSPPNNNRNSAYLFP